MPFRSVQVVGESLRLGVRHVVCLLLEFGNLGVSFLMNGSQASLVAEFQHLKFSAALRFQLELCS
jgi:hypothetical protein